MVDVDHSWGDEQVQLIIDGTHPYGKVPIRTRSPSPGVIFYGSDGVSSSVGQWIRRTREIWSTTIHLKSLWAFWSEESEEKNQKVWYFAIELGDELHVVGGCTDFSGEGGNARRIAAAYQNRIGVPVETRPASQLISYMVEGWYPYIRAKENFLDDHN